jgi:hypothetical protein
MKPRLLIAPKYDLRQLVTAHTDKRGRSVASFETIAEAQKERRHRVCVLMAQRKKSASALARDLAGCHQRAPCGSRACPVCTRHRRLEQSASILEFLEQYDISKLKLVTLINPADTRSAGQLHTCDVRKLVNRYRRQLERAGIEKSRAFLIGGLDGEWDAGWEVYQPHIHAITLGVTKSDLKTMTRRWLKGTRVRVKARLEPIDDLPRVVAYLDKSFWASVARKNNPLGIYPHGRRRPPQHIEAEILKFLNTQSALHILYGVKSYSGVISYIIS